jgi:hypothetical protein
MNRQSIFLHDGVALLRQQWDGPYCETGKLRQVHLPAQLHFLVRAVAAEK